ncbi:MAG: helix-turn-helix transcriptional regulator [Candidatus Auribacterota bacterium]
MKVFLQKQKIQEILVRKNKSQNWLAKKLQISTGYMSQLTAGSRNPSPELREKLMGMFPDKDFDDLFVIETI